MKIRIFICCEVIFYSCSYFLHFDSLKIKFLYFCPLQFTRCLFHIFAPTNVWKGQRRLFRLFEGLDFCMNRHKCLLHIDLPTSENSVNLGDTFFSLRTCILISSVSVRYNVWNVCSTLFEALSYKLEGSWFDSLWCHWNFSVT